MLRSLADSKPSVNEEDLEKLKKFTEDFGQEGWDSDTEQPFGRRLGHSNVTRGVDATAGAADWLTHATTTDVRTKDTCQTNVINAADYHVNLPATRQTLFNINANAVNIAAIDTNLPTSFVSKLDIITENVASECDENEQRYSCCTSISSSLADGGGDDRTVVMQRPSFISLVHAVVWHHYSKRTTTNFPEGWLRL